MLFYVTLVLFISPSSVISFPLKHCGVDKTDILFVLDCTNEVKEQIDFINTMVNYLRSNRNWMSLNVSYITYEDKEPTTLEVLTANITEKANEIFNKCKGIFSLDDVFLLSKQITSHVYQTMTINVIFLKIDDQKTRIIHKIDKQKKSDEIYRLFLIKNAYHEPATDTSYFREDVLRLRRGLPDWNNIYTELHNYSLLNDELSIDQISKEKMKQNSRNCIHFSKKFKDINILSLYPKICDLKCTDTNITFLSKNFQNSFYHMNYRNQAMHDQVVEYCDSQFNSYLISIETYEELDYVMSEILKINFNIRKDSKSVLIILGLVLRSLEPLFWSSGNPFVFFHKLENRNSSQCAYMNYTVHNKHARTFKDNKNFWKYLLQMDCKDILNEAYIVCECHQQLHVEDHFHIRPLNKPDTSGLFLPKNKAAFLNLRLRKSFQVLNCAKKNRSHFAKNYYFCKDNINFSSHLNTYVRVTFSEELNDGNVSLQCKNFLTINSKIKINETVEKCESFCYKHNLSPLALKCPYYLPKIHQQIPSQMCKIDGKIYPQCLKIYNKECRDNSHLVNCENFTCPDGFIKCPESYCIPIQNVGDKVNQCPLGQEKTIFKYSICKASMDMIFKDICIHRYSFHMNEQEETGLYSHHCDYKCPEGYRCYSSTLQSKRRRLIKFSTRLYNISNSLYPGGGSNFYLPYLQLSRVYLRRCRIRNVDKALENWNTAEIVILDLSKNEISNSDNFGSITSITSLLFLNLSSNLDLTIKHNFKFPKSLEVIDLSHTSVKSLSVNCFENLTSLRLLDLSYTRIHTFESMGLPQLFTIEILNIQGLVIKEIKADFYKGMTILTQLLSSDFKMCCPEILGANIPPQRCYAPDDAITSCKHIVGDRLKRISIWIVGLMTLAGNGIVLMYRIVWNRKKTFSTAYGLFVTSLAVSDLLMGVYLMIIAVVDMIYADVYVVHDASWRKSFFCQFSGFLATLSSETSTFFIGLITLDRFMSISSPFSADVISTKLKWKGFIVSWTFGFVLALMPIFVPEWEIYSSNGLCLALPLSTSGTYKLYGWEFSMAVYVILNFILFLFIALGQVGIFISIIKQRSLASMRHCSERRTQDMNIAYKLAFVALSDFLCWFPIGIMGIMSLNDQQFDKETYAWMAVFVLPVNSALNPLIYTVPIIFEKIRFNNYVVT